MAKKKAVALNEVATEAVAVVETKAPQRAVVRCPNCGTTLVILERLAASEQTVPCLACHAEYIVKKK